MTAEIRERANKLGQCCCPICHSKEADVLQGTRLPYIVCEDCGSLIQTRQKKGARLIAALLKPSDDINPPPDDPPPAPAPAPVPPKAPAKNSGMGFLGIGD